MLMTSLTVQGWVSVNLIILKTRGATSPHGCLKSRTTGDIMRIYRRILTELQKDYGRLFYLYGPCPVRVRCEGYRGCGQLCESIFWMQKEPSFVSVVDSVARCCSHCGAQVVGVAVFDRQDGPLTVQLFVRQ